MNLKKCFFVLLAFLMLALVVGCDKDKEKEGLTLPTLSTTYKGKTVLYVEGFQEKFVTTVEDESRMAYIQKFMDEHKDEDVYFAIGVAMSNFPDDYIKDFKMNGKTEQEYIAIYEEVVQYRSELEALKKQFYVIAKDVYGDTREVVELEVGKFTKYGEIAYKYNGNDFLVRQETIERFSSNGMFQIEKLTTYYDDVNAAQVIDAMNKTQEFVYEKKVASVKKHADYFKGLGFPSISIEAQQGQIVVIYVRDYKDIEDFKGYQDVNYHFSILGKTEDHYGFYWE